MHGALRACLAILLIYAPLNSRGEAKDYPHSPDLEQATILRDPAEIPPVWNDLDCTLKCTGERRCERHRSQSTCLADSLSGCDWSCQ